MSDPRMDWKLADMPTWERSKPEMDASTKSQLDTAIKLYRRLKKLTALAACKSAFDGEAANAAAMAKESRGQLVLWVAKLGISEQELERLASL